MYAPESHTLALMSTNQIYALGLSAYIVVFPAAGQGMITLRWHTSAGVARQITVDGAKFLAWLEVNAPDRDTLMATIEARRKAGNKTNNKPNPDNQ